MSYKVYCDFCGKALTGAHVFNVTTNEKQTFREYRKVRTEICDDCYATKKKGVEAIRSSLAAYTTPTTTSDDTSTDTDTSDSTSTSVNTVYCDLCGTQITDLHIYNISKDERDKYHDYNGYRIDMCDTCYEAQKSIVKAIRNVVKEYTPAASGNIGYTYTENNVIEF